MTVEVNSLGDAESRNAYREKLVAYLKEHFDELSADSKNRLERNPLRVLDSKEECDKAVVEKAPLYADSLNEKSKAFLPRCWTGWIGWESNTGLTTGWCAGWTIIRTPCLNW